MLEGLMVNKFGKQWVEKLNRLFFTKGLLTALKTNVKCEHLKGGYDILLQGVIFLID